MSQPQETVCTVLRGAARRTVSFAEWLVIFLAAVLPVFIWPGDVPWTNDEPRLLAAAWHANHDGRLASGGLYGNFGLRYGPLPTQIYQVLLTLAPDPLGFAVLRSALCAGVTTFSLLWLARVLGLTPWFAVPLCLAPQVWHHQRILWDASFTIPLSALALAAAAAFFQEPARWRLLLALGSTVLLPLIHPQALPLAVALAVGLVLRGHRELRRHWLVVVIVLGAVGALHAVYFVDVVHALVERLGGAVRSGYPAGQTRGLALLAPLLGGTLFSDAGFGGNVVPAAHRPPFWPVVSLVARLVYPLAWCGVAVAAGLALRRIAGAESVVRIVIARVALATLLMQALIFGLMRVPAEPQYFFGTFAVHALLPWLAVDGLFWKTLGRWLGLAYGLAVTALTLGGSIVIHRHGYAAEPPRVTLANQLEIARSLNAFSDTSALTDVALYQRYPQALRALRLLLPPRPDGPRPAQGKLVIRTAPGTSRVELLDAPADAMPSGLVPLDLTPLPKGWQPPSPR